MSKELFGIRTEDFRSVEQQASEVEFWRDRYDNLISFLGEVGSQVIVIRVLETEKDTPPHRFMRSAIHEFVFPSQEIKVSQNKSHPIETTPGYELYKEEIIYDYNPLLVDGHINVFYQDSDGNVNFVVSDISGRSEFPGEVSEKLSEIFALPEDTPVQK